MAVCIGVATVITNGHCEAGTSRDIGVRDCKEPFLDKASLRLRQVSPRSLRDHGRAA
jgi:hypothetical protein